MLIGATFLIIRHCAAVGCRAMGGSVKFEDALAARLNIMQLSQQRLNDFLKDHPARLSPGGKEMPGLARAPNRAIVCKQR